MKCTLKHSETLIHVTTDYLWDELSLYGDVVMESSGGTTTASYTLADTQLVSQNRSGATSYYLHDALGSTRSLADSAGVITDRYDYTAFGELYTSSGSTTNDFLFAGQMYDANTNLYQMRARYYSPSLGRFTSRDAYPYNIQNPIELNRYGYTANNPTNYTDPSGYTTMISRGLLGGFSVSFATMMLPPMAEFILTAILVLIASFAVAKLATGVMEGAKNTNKGSRKKNGSKPKREIPDFEIPNIDVYPDDAPTQPSAPVGWNPNGSGGGVNGLWYKLGLIALGALATFTLSSDSTGSGDSTDTNTDYNDEQCDPVGFTAWWFTLSRVKKGYQPGVPWYEYEQRVARGDGAYGDTPRDTSFVDADGIEPSTCFLVDSKYAKNPQKPMYRLDGPYWLNSETDKESDLLDETRRYHQTMINFPQVRGLIIRTNATKSVPFFRQTLMEAGFQLNVNSFVEYVP